jgi:hypothetical protein
MKDLIIPAKLIRRELLTTWPITLALAGIVYVLLILPRLCWAGLCRLLHDRRPLSSKTRLQSTQNAK